MARICVYGAGSIGVYLGGRLLAGGSEIAFVGRARMGGLLREHGVVLTHYDGGRWEAAAHRIDYATEAAAAATADLVLVSVKSAATAEAGAELAAVLPAGVPVISFQNGVRNAEVLRAALPDNPVLAGMVPFNVVERGLGVFHQGTGGELEVQRSAVLQPFLADFSRAGLPLVEHDDMLPVQWAKCEPTIEFDTKQ